MSIRFGFISSDDLGCHRDQRWTGMVKISIKSSLNNKYAEKRREEERRQTLRAVMKLASL